MKVFLKPSLVKILLAMILFIISFYITQIMLGFGGLSMSSMCLPKLVDENATPTPTPIPANLHDVIQNIPVAMSGNYYRGCESPSLQVAQQVITGITLLTWFIFSYLSACVIAYLFIRRKRTKPSSKKI